MAGSVDPEVKGETDLFIIKAIRILLWFLILPFGIGNLPIFREKNTRVSFADALVSGYASMFFMFELLALPLIFTRQEFSTLKTLYGVISILLAMIGGFCIYRGERNPIRKYQWKMPKISFWLLAAVGLILIQMCAYVFGMATDLDDSFYVASATTTLQTNGMFTYGAYTGNLSAVLPSRYVLAPFPILLAFYSDMVGMHPAVMAHTIQPVFFLMLSYLVYWKIGKKLFGKNEKSVGVFLFFLAWIQMFSYYSVYTQGTFMLIRIWQGKAVLASFLLPAVFLQARSCMEQNVQKTEWMKLFVLMGASTLVSSMGMMLAPLVLGITLLSQIIRRRSWRKVRMAMLCCIPNLICAAMYLLMR